ncbi:hypothetical protein Sste5346_008876 [Sporothrix stenoceras]|uniref:Uncharacterized protein n=1 Tax=Sporothrix stenoceras TaxID=5173 RepID=A0ABR3YNN5_9PEZI
MVVDTILEAYGLMDAMYAKEEEVEAAYGDESEESEDYKVLLHQCYGRLFEKVRTKGQDDDASDDERQQFSAQVDILAKSNMRDSIFAAIDALTGPTSTFYWMPMLNKRTEQFKSCFRGMSRLARKT